MNYFSGLLVAWCFVVFILYMAIEAVRVRQGEKRRFEARFWLFAAFVVLVLVFPRWFAARSGGVVWPQTMTTNILGDLATVLGLILVIQSRLGRIGVLRLSSKKTTNSSKEDLMPTFATRCTAAFC